MTDPIVRTTHRRVAVAAAGTAVAVVAGVVLAFQAPRSGLGAGVALVWLVVFGAFYVLTTADRSSPRQRQKAATACTLTPLVLWLAALERYPDVPVWGWAVTVPPVLGLCYLAGHLAAGPDAHVPATGQAPAGAARIPLGPADRVLWTRTVVSRRGMIGVAILLAAAALQLVSPTNPGALTVAVMLVVAAVWSLLCAHVRVRVDGSGVRVEQPLLRRALVSAPIEEVRQARATTLDPGRLGWNEHGVLRSPGVSGYRATRRGETLSLDLAGGREFLVTVPDAGTAAGLVNSELDRQRAGDRTC